MEFRSTGKGMRKISKELGVGVSTVKRVIDEARVA
jgi:transposase